jgi:lipopolysaccharide export LptBFGC system permease protein LptF
MKTLGRAALIIILIFMHLPTIVTFPVPIIFLIGGLSLLFVLHGEDS